MQPLNIFHILISLGSLQGFFLAATFFRSKRYGRVSNKYLAILLLCCSMLNLMNISWDVCIFCEYPFVKYLPLDWSVLLPFSLYYFVIYLIDPEHQPSQWRWTLLGPVLLYFLIGIIRLLLFLTLPDVHARYEWTIQNINRVIEGVAIVQFFIILFLIFKRLNFFQRDLYNHFSNLEQKSLIWLRYALVGITVLAVMWVLAEYNDFIDYWPQRYLLYPTAIGMSVIIYWLAYMMHLRTDLFEMPQEVVPATDANHDTQVDTEVSLSVNTEKHYQKVLSLMNNDGLYRDPDLSMTMLAEKTGLSRGYLSQIMNQKEGKTFYEFVNHYRVEQVKHYFADKRFDHYTALGIAQESGFKSKSTFNAVFKKMTGMTPSQYKKSL